MLIFSRGGNMISINLTNSKAGYYGQILSDKSTIKICFHLAFNAGEEFDQFIDFLKSSADFVR